MVADSSINAPIEQGQKCGELIVLRDNKEIGKVDLVAEKNINKAGFGKIFREMIGSLFTIDR